MEYPNDRKTHASASLGHTAGLLKRRAVLENFPPILSTMATSQEVLEFGRLKHRCDRADLHDWMEVLEFLGFLQTLVFESVEPEVVDIPRAELAVVVGANIQFWRASIEKGFLGTLYVVRQFVGLRASLERLRCALEKMEMIDPSAGIKMKPACTINFTSDNEAGAGSNELNSEHFPR